MQGNKDFQQKALDILCVHAIISVYTSSEVIQCRPVQADQRSKTRRIFS
nr:MAG TPA: hypothetical protein [Caudoviricetes sp.]